MSIESVFSHPKQHVLVAEKSVLFNPVTLYSFEDGTARIEVNPLQGNNVDSSITKGGMSSSETRLDETRDSLARGDFVAARGKCAQNEENRQLEQDSQGESTARGIHAGIIGYSCRRSSPMSHKNGQTNQTFRAHQ